MLQTSNQRKQDTADGESPVLSNCGGMIGLSDLRPGSRVERPKRLVSPALAVLAFCLILGTLAVVWRAHVGADKERVQAQTEAAARGSALQLQFGRALRAAEILGALARQSGGTIPDFQRVAAEIHAAFPELASLELQPGGVVSDIVPRAGNERAIGFNVFRDPAYRGGAIAALQSRKLFVVTPLILYGGEPGLVVRVPVFQKGRGGQDQFWGFVAVSMRLSECLRRAGLSELSKRGYDYVLFVVGGSASGKPSVIASQGIQTVRDAVQEPIGVQNVEFRLALRRQGGWIRQLEVLLECAVVVLTSCALFFMVNALSSRRRLEVALEQAKRQLAVETAEREKAQTAVAEARAGGQRELANLRAALQQAHEEIERHTQALNAATENQRLSDTSLKHVRFAAAELQTKFDRVVQSHAEEMAAVRTELADARTALETGKQKVRELEDALAEAQHAQSGATAPTRDELAKAQESVKDLQAQLLSARKEAQTAAARFEEIDTINRDLRLALAEAQQALVKSGEVAPQAGTDEADTVADVEAVTASEPPMMPVAAIAEEERLVTAPLEAISPPDANAPEANSTPPAQVEVLATPQVVSPAAPPKKRKRSRDRDRTQIELFGDPVSSKQAAQHIRQGATAEQEAIDSSSPPVEQPDRAAEAAASPKQRESASEIQATEANDTPETDVKPELRARENKPAAARQSDPQHPVDTTELRRAVNEMLPLLADRDPGARDCLKANRMVFRSAFSAAAFEEFEQFVKGGDSQIALEQLKKTARKHGINI